MDTDAVQQHSNLKRKGKFESRVHSKKEKREQRKRWKKRKQQQKDKGDQVGSERRPQVQPIQESSKPKPLSRGKKIVELALEKRKVKAGRPTSNICGKTKDDRRNIGGTRGLTKSKRKSIEVPTSQTLRPFKEINRSLMVRLEEKDIGSGTFGKCYLALYRGEFQVLVKEIKQLDESPSERQKAKREVLHEANVLSALGDHPGLPHLFGVCTKSSPYCLVVQFYHVNSRGLTLLDAASNTSVTGPRLIKLLSSVCQTLSHMHSEGFIHNDLKGNNVVLGEGLIDKEYNATIIDFGKTVRISEARLKKPKLNVNAALKNYPHVAPEIHRGERQSVSRDVYSFGYMMLSLAKNIKLKCLDEIIQKCTSISPTKRPSLTEVSTMLSDISL